MTLDQLIDELKQDADALGSQKRLAIKMHVSAAYLGDVLNGRKEPGPKILSAKRIRRVVSYERIGRGDKHG